MTFGQRIKERRLELSLTQEDLAKALGVSPQHISAIEQDKRAPGIYSLVKLAKTLGTTTDYLLTGEETILAETLPAIRADKKLSSGSKKALVVLVQELYQGSS